MSAREVTLVGGSPWGFRMHGGHDLHQPLRISRVNPGSKAAQQGVREGDLISSINDKSTRDLTNGESHALLRNAGDHLKLGLNQDTGGSPKRRIYKSSLQENTSIETLKKTTTKTTTTSSTQILSSEANRSNGIDDTRTERGILVSQNGGLKKSPIATERGRTDGETKRSRSRPIVDTSGYITEDSEGRWNGIKMPKGSRTRQKRRNRNNKRTGNNQQRPGDRQTRSAATGDNDEQLSDLESVANDDPVKHNDTLDRESRGEDTDTDLELAEKCEKDRYTPMIREIVDEISNEFKEANDVDSKKIVDKSANENVNASLTEAKVNGHPVRVTTEETTSRVGEGCIGTGVAVEFQGRRGKGSIDANRGSSSASFAAAKRRRLRVERRAMNTETKIFEITSVSGLPLAASIDHVAGVGILETGMTTSDDAGGTIVTISEPIEPVEPLPCGVASKVDTLLGQHDFAMALLARAPNNKRDGPEIHEVSDSDADTDNSSNRPTTAAAFVVEAESDVERDSVPDRRCHESIAEEVDDETDLEENCRLEDIEIPEIGGSAKNEDESTNETEEKSVDTNDHDGDNFSTDLNEENPESVDVESLPKEDSEEKFDEKGVPDDEDLQEESSSVEDDSLEEKFDLVVRANESEVNNEKTATIKDEGCVKVRDSDASPLVAPEKHLEAKGATEVDKSEPDMEVPKEMSPETSQASLSSKSPTIRVIPIDVEKSVETSDSSVTTEVANKLKLFIESLELPSLREDAQIVEIERESNESSSQRRAKKRALLESYYAEAKNADRFLDIIQEEGDNKFSESDERHIRDFINGEIGKFRREQRDSNGKAAEFCESNFSTNVNPNQESSMSKKVQEDDNESAAREIGNLQKEDRKVDFEAEFGEHDFSANESATKGSSIREKVFEEKSESSTKTEVGIGALGTVKNQKKVLSTEETRREITKISRSEEKKVSIGCEEKNGIKSNAIPNAEEKMSTNEASNGIARKDDCSTNESEPPAPPARFSTPVAENEPLRPPTPPDIDFLPELPEVPALPDEVLLAPQRPPVPPMRRKNSRLSKNKNCNESPQRPPLPDELYAVNDRTTSERIYENVHYAKRVVNSRLDDVPPALPPLPLDFEAFWNDNDLMENSFELTDKHDDFHRFYYRSDNSRMITRSEIFDDHRPGDQPLRNNVVVDEADIGRSSTGNDAKLEIAPSAGNHVDDENAAVMLLRAEEQQKRHHRDTATPNFGHSSLARRRPKVSRQVSDERCADIIEINKQNPDVKDPNAGIENITSDSGDNFVKLSDARNNLSNCKVENETLTDENKKNPSKERIVPIELSSEFSTPKIKKFVEHVEHSEETEFHRTEDFYEEISSFGGRSSVEKLIKTGGSSAANIVPEAASTSIDESKILSNSRSGCGVSVENNQAERPARPPRRQQKPSYHPTSSRLFEASNNAVTSSSHGQTNSGTVVANKNSVDGPSDLPALILPKESRKEFDPCCGAASPEQADDVDDQESSSSGAASPNTVRFNPSSSFTDLASLEIREEHEKDTRHESRVKIENSSISDTRETDETQEDLYYVPLGDENVEDARKLEDPRPDLLKDLCIRKILSLPYGLQIINEITLSKFNILNNLQTIQECANVIAENRGCYSDSEVTADEMSKQKQRPRTWMGVPTIGDPRLLVCLSPSQQENTVRTSADNLLDLHKKYLNRRSYHEDRRGGEEVKVPRYRVDLRPEIKSRDDSIGRVKEAGQGNQQIQDRRASGPANRLLEIIKENPITSSNRKPSVDPAKSMNAISGDNDAKCSDKKSEDSRDFRQDRLRATRLSDWLCLARRDNLDYAFSEKSETQDFVTKTQGSERSTGATRGSSVRTIPEESVNDNAKTRNSAVDNEAPNREEERARYQNQNESGKTRNTSSSCYERMYDKVITEMENSSQLIGKRFGESAGHRVNSALIVRSAPGSDEKQQAGVARSATPSHFDKSPISLKSAIIDKSANDAGERKWTPPSVVRGTIDSRHVNPALIDDRDNREATKAKSSRRPIVVDRSCIDTTSIFDKTPPRCRLEPRKYQDHEALKQNTATEIIENLKRLQGGAKNQYQRKLIVDNRRRYSLPQELFERQLDYIEQLENQLKEVIIAEEEERRAYEEFQGQIDADNLERIRSMIDLDDDREWDKLGTGDWANDCKLKNLPEGEVDKRESWREESRTEDDGHSEFTKKEGHREATKSVIDRGNVRVENSSTSFENVEERSSSSGMKSIDDPAELDSQWKRFFDDEKIPDCFTGSRSGGGRDDAKSASFANEKPSSSTEAKRANALPVNGEIFRRKMYDEYVHKVLEREERKQHKVIKISSHADLDKVPKRSGASKSEANSGMTKMEKEFIERARNRMSRFGINLDDSSESETINNENGVIKKSEETTMSFEKSVETSNERVEKTNVGETAHEAAKCLIDGREIKDAKCLPKHLQEFLELATSNGKGEDGVWSPGSEPPPPPKQPSPERGKNTDKDAGIPPVWTPSSAGPSPVAERKEFRPVAFESPVLSRKKLSSQISSGEPSPPWKEEEDNKRDACQTVTHNITTRIVNSHSAPSQGLNTLADAPRLPRAQNPTITLLQKAREGQLPKGAAYLEDSESSVQRIGRQEGARIDPGEIIYTVKREYESEPETEREKPKKMADLGPRKIEGIGPTTKDGMPVALRSEVKDSNQARWYKKMYDSLHRADKDDDYITVRYKPRRGARHGYGSASGYLSEPEPRGYSERSVTLDTRRRQRNKENDFSTSTMPRKTTSLKHTEEVYRNQPGRIEDYVPGRSSIADKETKEWWDEVMDIFDGPFDQRNPHTAKPYMSHALKESGYESDSTLIFRRRDDASPLSPLEQRLAYKTVQKGGDVPLHGLRKPAPERPKEYANAPPPPPKAQHNRSDRQESPRRYVEGEVTIHYRSPVRQEAKEILSEEELARRSAENMRRVYQEERRRKYLQELHDIDSRRHTDNFVASQKSPISLNRYDDFVDDLSYRSRSQEQTPEPRLVARALYNFVGQSSRELTFRRGDIIFVRRQVDKNWYEGEHNAMIGLFPFNYVEILPFDGTRTTPKKPYEGQARAKFNFVAQTNLELSLAKGELVVITRRVDENWYEGRIGNRKGIFPISYVEVLAEPGHRSETPVQSKPVASPAAHSLLSNGTAGGKMSMGAHHYTPSIPVNTSTTQPHYNSLPRMGGNKLHVAPVNETLHIDTHSETIPYRALYNYRPQNEDELELREGDTVYVMEKCDDGWFVGSSQRTAYFGTFPGNYVERL